MKQFTGNEKAGLALAAVLVVGGASLIVCPLTGLVLRAAMANNVSSSSVEDFMTPAKSQLMGAVAIACGATLATIIYCGKT